MTPVIEDNCLLVDGGLFNNVPADIMKEICGGIVIMVNVSPEEDLLISDQFKKTPSDMEVLWSHLNPFKEKITFPRIQDIMMRTIMVGSERMKNQTSKSADYIFSPNLDRFGMLEFDAIDAIIDAGYRYAQERIIELQMKGCQHENPLHRCRLAVLGTGSLSVEHGYYRIQREAAAGRLRR